MKKTVDKTFLVSVITLSVAGLFIFASASLGILAKNKEQFVAIATNQVLLGFVLGMIALTVTSHIPYEIWRKYSLALFISAFVLSLLVFVPGIGVRHGGALRWIDLGFTSFQPSEALKIGYIIYIAAILSKYKDKVEKARYGLLPFVVITGLVGTSLLLEPDNDTFFMTFLAGISMFIVAGARIKHLVYLGLIGVIGIGAIIYTRPYVKDRIMTFLDPAKNPLSSGYQVQQSQIAIGSGGILGKGFGQSTQKFGFLPEPIGDSIFAVLSEEFGFVGGSTLIILFILFALRGLKIASGSTDMFGRLLATGIVIIIVSGSFMNIASMIGIMPLSGTPLLFVSHGGTALLIALAEVGIILNISRKKR